MNRRVFFAALAAVVAFTAAPVAAQDINGTWEITSEGPRGAMTQTLALAVKDGKLTGTVTMTMGGRGGRGGGGAGGAGGPMVMEISNAKLEGNAFSFTMEMSMGGNSFSQEYKGTFEGDTMKGEIAGARGARPFTGKRAG